MKLGIFGDSFGARDSRPDLLSWPDHLEKDYKVELENFCVGSASMWYSYKKFLENHQKFDKIVFFVGGSNRLSVFDKENNSYIHIRPQTDFEANPEFNKNPLLIKLQTASDLYYEYLIDQERDREYVRLIYEEMKRIRPDTLFIPSFPGGPLKKEITMLDLHMIDVSHWEFSADEDTDRRHCHMNCENNKIFGDLIANWLQTTNFHLDLQTFVTSSNPKELYFPKKHKISNSLKRKLSKDLNWRSAPLNF